MWSPGIWGGVRPCWKGSLLPYGLCSMATICCCGGASGVYEAIMPSIRLDSTSGDTAHFQPLLHPSSQAFPRGAPTLTLLET